MPLSVRVSGFVMSESWFVLTVSALTGTVPGALNKAVSFLCPVSSLKPFFSIYANHLLLVTTSSMLMLLL